MYQLTHEHCYHQSIQQVLLPHITHKLFNRYTSLPQHKNQQKGQVSSKENILYHKNLTKKAARRQSKVSEIPFSIASEKQIADVQQFKLQKQKQQQISWNLTSILITSDISKNVLFVLFGAFVLMRYISIVYTLYFAIFISLAYLQILSILMVSNLMYWICIIKISLKPPETHSEIFIKCVFDSLEQDIAGEYFQTVSIPKLMQSIAKSIVPAEFAFIFIGTLSTERRRITYLMINFIYCSSEAVIYFPGFMIYNICRFTDASDPVQNTIYVIVMSLMLISWSWFMLFAAYLVCRAKKMEHSSKK